MNQIHFKSILRGTSLIILMLIPAISLCQENPIDSVAPEKSHGISKADLAGCEMHVVGMYMPRNHSQDDRLYVDIKDTGKPMVLVLTGYFGAQWNLKIDPKADVRQIIVAGYYKHELAEPHPDVPISFLTYFPAADKKNRDYFWAYGWNTAEGRELKKRLNELTGLNITTFQGEYEPKRFVIDGAKGRDVVEGRSSGVESESSSGFLDLLFGGKKPAGVTTGGSGEIPPDVSSVSVPPKEDRSLLAAARTSAEIAHRTTEDHSRSAARDYRAESAQETPDPNALAELKEKLTAAVKAGFEAQMNLQQVRIQIAQQDLAEVVAKHQRRQSLADKIIERRIADLINGDDLEWAAQKKDPSATISKKSSASSGPIPEAVKDRATVQELVDDWSKRTRALGDDAAEQRDAAIKEIETALQSDDVIQLQAATTALAQLGDVKFDKAKFRSRLLELARSNDGDIQTKVFYALANTDRRVGDLALLQEVLQGSHSDKLDGSASHLLMIFGGGTIRGTSEDIVLKLLNSSDRSVRREALRGLWGAKTSDKLMERVIELVDDKESHNDSIYFALATGPEKNAAVIDKLIEVLSDSDWNNWDRALWGLGFGVPESEQTKVAAAMLQMYETRSDPRTREKCAKLVQQYGDASQQETLKTLQKSPEKPSE